MKKKILTTLYIILLVGIVIFSYNHRIAKRNGWSNYPTFNSGDIALYRVVRNKNDIHRYDFISFYVDNNKKGYQLEKRVIGLPGEELIYDKGIIYVNGAKIDDKYCDEYGDERYVKLKLANDEYFVLGDNRPESVDSRDIGPIKYDWIKTKAIYTILKGKER